MRASHLLIPAGLIGGLLLGGPAAERVAARNSKARVPTAQGSAWDDLANALDDASVRRSGRIGEPARADVTIDLSGSLEEMVRVARELERMSRRLDVEDLESRLDELGIDVDDLDDLQDHLENLEEAIEDLAEFAGEIEGRWEIRVHDGKVIVAGVSDRRRR